ncbi:hypothetical protein SAY86_011495 [Trapa natans]|uniref:C3HC-type domain-containing protein n=1 Tax=Trapa natans TaxID=22666 RepID=A0AAN7LJ24_TRANT|nr:hypothetical protein SAY86_011495 [Trapa natans]
MKEEVISSGGNNNDAFTIARSSPAASSAGASSPAVLVNAGSVEWLGNGQPSKGGSVSYIGHPPKPSLSTNAAGCTVGSFQASCRPWERGDLLRRLATFNPSNWFSKPKAASSLACARRGWINVDLNKIECESCGASFKYSSFSKTQSGADGAEEDFAEQLDGGHKVGCPWRGNSCPESLVQFPPAPPSALIGGYKDRCDGLLQFSVLPVVSTAAVEQMQVSRGPQMERFLSNSQTYVHGELGFKAECFFALESLDENMISYTRAQKLISLCGWEARWLPNIQDCEEHSAQSARNGNTSSPLKKQGRPQDPGPSRKEFSSSANRDYGQDEAPGSEFKCESRSPLLDCSLCGATVRIWDFSTVARPARFAPNGIDLPETSKKMALTRGISAASGICGWIGHDGVDKDRTDDHDEAATTGKRRFTAHTGMDLNLATAGGLSSTQVNMTVLSQQQQQQDVDLGRDLKTGQPSGSEVGDRAASYESRGPGTRKRSADEGGSTVDRPPLRIHQADSVEGTVIDRDGDEVNDSRQYSTGPSKRARSSDAFGAYRSSCRSDSSDAGPSRPIPFEMEADANRCDPFVQGSDQIIGFHSTRDSTHVSSVIAMDINCHSADDDSLESVENFPIETDDVNFPSASTYANPDLNDVSDLNYSNQAQQSACFQQVPARPGEAGVSSTIDGEEVVNTEALTTQVRDGISFGISGGSIGMGASYEAEIHGTDVSVHRSDSVVGDAEPVAEVIENQGQTGEFAPDVGNTDYFVPEEMERDDPHGDSQDVISHSIGRADSGSKIVGSAKAESNESGEKTRNMDVSVQGTIAHPSLSCNAIICSGYEASKEEVSQAQKASPTNEGRFLESSYDVANGIAIGPPVGESNYEEEVEFNPINHHNAFCPWVNGNVAAAGSTSDGSSSSSCASAAAFCGWQLTLDALDTFQTLGIAAAQTVESESAASRHKDDRLTPSRNLLACHSFSKSRGQN